jgi:uncharacterized RDD family membrane protein YckC
MLGVMNAIAQASARSATGPQLDNRRVIAGLVDIAIVAVGAAVVLFAGDSLSGDSSNVQGALGAVITGWALYYYFALESGDGQTVGKKLMKLRVVRADGRPAGMREIAVRTILRVVDGLGVYIVGLITMLATGERRQRIGDLAAGTIVVDASTPTAAPPVPAASVDALEFSAPLLADDEVVEDEPVEDEPVFAPSITLPARRERPETLADMVGSDAPEEEPVVEEPVLEVEPEPIAEVEEEPVVEVEPEPVAEEAPVIEVEAADEDLLPEISSPAIEELARDVEAARTEPVADAEAPSEDKQDEPMTVKSVETVSAIDLVMGGASEDEDPSEDSSEPA